MRDSAALDDVAAWPAPEAPGLRLAPGDYLFATIHRAENREPAALFAWTALLDRVSAPDRPVVLAIHPGTRAALQVADRDGGKRERRRAAGLSDVPGPAAPMGGRPHRLRRRPARSGLAGRALPRPPGTTEWIEAVEASEGRMVVVDWS